MMREQTIGIISPGDMGHAVGRHLVSRGLRVITCLQGRSQRSVSLARRANITDRATYRELVEEADILLSILVPAQALQAAQVVAKAISETRTGLLYVDCNAVAPQTACRIGETIMESGGRFVDVGIIGSPPGKKGTTTFFYASGGDVDALEPLSRHGLTIIPLGERIGQASAMKMCYAASTKGLVALFTELLTAAEALGISRALRERLTDGKQTSIYEQMAKGIEKMPEKSKRWVGEMEEIAKTFDSVGLTPSIFTGAADIYRFVSGTDLAERTPEDPTPPPDLDRVIGLLAHCLPEFRWDAREEKQSP